MESQLLLTKRLYIEAKHYVERQDTISSGIAISMLHDAVELYIWTLLKHKDLTVKDQSPFTTNLDILQNAKIWVPFKGKLLELNKARINFKHYGNLPAIEEARKHQDYVEEFLSEAMNEHFGIAFDSLSLADLILDEEIRGFLKRAEGYMEYGKLNEAAIELAKARYCMFGKLAKYIPSVDRKLTDADAMFARSKPSQSINPFSYIYNYLGVLRESALISLLRLSVNDFDFLKTALPSSVRTLSGRWSINLNRHEYPADLCKSAYDRLINIMLQIQATPINHLEQASTVDPGKSEH